MQEKNMNKSAAREAGQPKLLPMRLYLGTRQQVPGSPNVPVYETAEQWAERLGLNLQFKQEVA